MSIHNLDVILCLCQRYEAKHLKTVNKLQKQHQQVASVLAEAEQLGLIDVSLVMVTRHEWLQVNQRFGCSVEEQETTANHWMRLDGSKQVLTQERVTASFRYTHLWGGVLELFITCIVA